jgi:hypothetical protein
VHRVAEVPVDFVVSGATGTHRRRSRRRHRPSRAGCRRACAARSVASVRPRGAPRARPGAPPRLVGSRRPGLVRRCPRPYGRAALAISERPWFRCRRRALRHGQRGRRLIGGTDILESRKAGVGAASSPCTRPWSNSYEASDFLARDLGGAARGLGPSRWRRIEGTEGLKIRRRDPLGQPRRAGAHVCGRAAAPRPACS